MASAAAVPRYVYHPSAAEKSRPGSHCGPPATPAKAMHAARLATTMSTPSGLRDDAAERNSSGTASVTLAPAGKAIMRAESTVAFMAAEALQGSAREGAGGAGVGEGAAHAPALLAFAPAAAQQPHAVQPGVSSADAAQQQPPRHRPLPQLNALAQASPGENAMQAPSKGAHASQPARAALALQHAPPRHAPEAHAASAAQGAPAAASMGGAALAAAVAEATADAAASAAGACVRDALPQGDARLEPLAVAAGGVTVYAGDAEGAPLAVAEGLTVPLRVDTCDAVALLEAPGGVTEGAPVPLAVPLEETLGGAEAHAVPVALALGLAVAEAHDVGEREPRAEGVSPPGAPLAVGEGAPVGDFVTQPLAEGVGVAVPPPPLPVALPLAVGTNDPVGGAGVPDAKRDAVRPPLGEWRGDGVSSCPTGGAAVDVGAAGAEGGAPPPPPPAPPAPLPPQVPAVAAVVDALAQHAQPSEQPPPSSATAGAQQQPPAHSVVEQSKFTAQASPGCPVAQPPPPSAQVLHPMRTASALQQAPPRHTPGGAQAAAAAQAPPAAEPPGGTVGSGGADARAGGGAADADTEAVVEERLGDSCAT
jgi:hypothetical protein